MIKDTQTWESVSSEIPVDGALTGEGLVQGSTSIAEYPKQIPITDKTYSLTIPVGIVLLVVIIAISYTARKKMNLKKKSNKSSEPIL